MDVLLGALGLKKLVVLAGFVGGAISGGVMPGALAVLDRLWKRVLGSAVSGAAIAGFAAEPLAAALERPGYLQGIALGLGLFGLSFVFKLLKAWYDFDLGGVLSRLIGNYIGRDSK